MSGVATNVPVASKHLFLHQVAREPVGTKVRFLCCVISYEVSKASLHVEHQLAYDGATKLSTALEVTQVLESVHSTDLEAGSWLNVIGYVRRSLPNKTKRKRPEVPAPILLPHVVIQAILIWNAGAIKISDYERTLSHQQDVSKLAMEAVTEQLEL